MTARDFIATVLADLFPVLAKIVVLALGAIGTWLAAKLSPVWLRLWNNKALASSKAALRLAAGTAVSAMYQTVVADLKNPNLSTKGLTARIAADVKLQAIDKVKAAEPNAVSAVLAHGGMDGKSAIEAMIGDMVEEAVVELNAKMTKKSVVTVAGDPPVVTVTEEAK